MGKASHKWRFRSHDNEVDPVRLAESPDRIVVGDIEVDQFRLLADARVARSGIELGQKRACCELPGQRVFASTGTDQEYVHQAIPGASRGRVPVA